MTLHKFVAIAFANSSSLKKILHGIEYIVIDEVSMMVEIFYKIFITIKRIFPKIKFIIIGDYLQCEPVKDRIICDYENSPALYELCDGNKIQLNKCRRSDERLFNLCKSIYTDINKDNINRIEIDLKQFKTNFTQRHICYTNRKRKELNHIMMANKIDSFRKSKTKMPFIYKASALPWDGNSQDVIIMKDTPIIARINCKKYDVYNNEQYEITDINNETFSIKDINDKSKTVMDIPTSEFQKMFYVAYAITTHKCQGCSLDHPYNIWEYDCMSWRLRYVSLSRARKFEYINIIVE